MAGPIYIVDNLLDQGVSFFSTSNNTSLFPYTLWHDKAQSKRWRAGITGTVYNWVELPVAQTPDVLAIHNHNIDPSWPIYLMYGASGAYSYWDASAYYREGSLYIPIKELVPTIGPHTHWGIRVNGTTSRIEWGQMVLGYKKQLDRQVVWGASMSHFHGVVHNTTPSGRVWSTYKHSPRRRWSAKFSDLLSDELAQVITWHNDAMGSHLPFTFIPYPDDPTALDVKEVWYVRHDPSLSWVDDFNKEASLELVEESRGIV